jgi:cytidine deaminase
MITRFLVLGLLICNFTFAKEIKKENLQKWQAELINSAIQAQEKTYSPYSHYPVGAAIITDEGKVFLGTNIENASYGLTICAERSAVFNAVTSGEKNIQAIAIVTKNGGLPCGACRQVLNEFNPEMIVLISDTNKTIIKEYKLSELLLDGFGPKNLD